MGNLRGVMGNDVIKGKLSIGKGEQGEQGLQGEKGDTGKSIEYNWRGTELGIRQEGTTEYEYVDLKGGVGTGDTHRHMNKAELDKITIGDVDKWNNLSGGGLTPEQATNINKIPTIESQLEHNTTQLEEHLNNHPSGEGGNVLTHKLNGVKWGFLGDSITDKNHAPANQHYDKVICDYTGAISYNYGVLATTVQIRDGRTDSMLERVDIMDNDVDIVTVLGGTNDYGLSLQLGSLNNGDNKTFYGAYDEMVKKLILKYPNKPIGLITPIARGFSTKLNDFATAIKEIGKKYCVPVLDLYSESGLCCDIPEINSAYFLLGGDKLHPNVEGQKIIARQILSFGERIYYNFDKKIEDIRVESVTLNKTNININVGSTDELIATVFPINATNKTVIWSSSNNAMATVNNGIVTGKSNGNCIITATTVDGSKTATCSVIINTQTDINLYNKDDVILMKQVNGADGSLLDNPNFNCSANFINVQPSKSFRVNTKTLVDAKGSNSPANYPFYIVQFDENENSLGNMASITSGSTAEWTEFKFDNRCYKIKVNIHITCSDLLKIIYIN